MSWMKIRGSKGAVLCVQCSEEIGSYDLSADTVNGDKMSVFRIGMDKVKKVLVNLKELALKENM